MTHLHTSKRSARREHGVSLFLYRGRRFLLALVGYKSVADAALDAEPAGTFFGADEFDTEDNRTAGMTLSHRSGTPAKGWKHN